MTAERREAIVAGAGPVGLSAALALRALGVPVTLLEAEGEERVRPGSRALFIHRDTLRLLERARPGLGRALAGHGIMWRTRRTLYRGREVFRRTHDAPSASALPPFTSLRQVETERHLLAACRDAGVELVWGARVETVATDAGGVTLTDASGRAWRAEYAIAADGARSAVRRALGIRMQGPRAPNFHVVVDLAEAPGRTRHHERVFHYADPAMDGRNVLLVPFAGGWQVDLQCRSDDDPAAFADPEAVRRWLPRVIDGEYAERILWTSTYHFTQAVADRLVDDERHVLLAGEAAHLFAPFGARGMNSGIADADAAAIAIALARGAHHTRAVAAIDEYARARGQAAAHNRRAAGAALAHMQPRGLAVKARRRLAAEFAGVVPGFGAWLEHAPYGPRTPASAGGRY